MNRPVKRTTLLLFIMVSLIYTIAIAGCMANGTQTNRGDWIRAKKAGTIACSPAGLAGASTSNQEHTTEELDKDHRARKDTGLPGKDQSNGCAHQMGTGALCESTGPRRRFIKAESC